MKRATVHPAVIFALGIAAGGLWTGNDALAAASAAIAVVLSVVLHLSRKRPGEPEDDRQHGDWGPPR